MGRTGSEGTQMCVNDIISDGVISCVVLGGIAGLLIGAGSIMIPGLGIIAAADRLQACFRERLPEAWSADLLIWAYRRVKADNMKMMLEAGRFCSV